MAWYSIVFLNLEAKRSERVMVQQPSREEALRYARAAFGKKRAFTSFELWQQGRLLHRETGQRRRWLRRKAATNG